MKTFLLFALSLFTLSITASAQVMDLYGSEASIPNFTGCANKETYKPAENANAIGIVSKVSRPTLEVFLPKTANAARSAVVICPGGGYGMLAVDHEGKDVAKAFNEMGVAAFVLKYRIPDSACMTSKETVPLMDAQQAMRIVRENAIKWNIDANKIGVMGFSAGGHLASTLGTHYADKLLQNPGNISLRPDFMILIYPVISFRDSVTHKGSKASLIGRNPSESLVNKFSNEEQVDANTPPSFLVHTLDDKTVPFANSVRFVEALQRNRVPAELHLYQAGDHGFGMNNKTTKDQWMERLKNWLLANKFL
jgi:acetyl esterase/lipase